LNETLPTRGNPGERPDVLSSREAGGAAIRGGMLRVGGYVLGLLLALVSIPILTRHLGVDEFGRYVTVLSIIAVVGLIADAGLTVVGVREYAVRDDAGRSRLVRNLVSLRAIVAFAGVLGAGAFALAAGYPNAMVAGTLLAGAALVLTVVQLGYTVPLQADLRLGAVTALDLARQALTAAAILVLVAAGAGLLGFLAISVPVSVLVLVATMFAIRRGDIVRPGFDWSEWGYLMREAIPVAIASTIGSFFYRIAIIMMSLIATAEETGYFSASFRIVEAIMMVPGLAAAAAFPIVARAAHGDRPRLAYALERLFDIGVILGSWIAVCVVLGAGPAIAFVGGPDYEPAVEVLRIQGLAITATFLVAVWATGLWALREQRALAWANLVGVAVAAGLTAALIPGNGAVGAAVAMTVAEILLAAMYAFILMRRRPEMRPALSTVPKVILAAGLALATWFLPVHDLVKVVAATVLFYGAVTALRGIPIEVMAALRERRSPRPTGDRAGQE
jgi:O-antigen/teichoic acid export membrane protein